MWLRVGVGLWLCCPDREGEYLLSISSDVEVNVQELVPTSYVPRPCACTRFRPLSPLSLSLPLSFSRPPSLLLALSPPTHTHTTVNASSRFCWQPLGRYKTIAGSWLKGKTALGCHLQEDWKRNPAFVINCPVGGTESYVARSQHLATL